MIEIDKHLDAPLDELFLDTIATSLTDKEIELIITTNSYIQEINATHRNIDAPTDVLSFPYEEMPMGPLGSIVISYDFVIQKAKELSHSPDDELALLFIHGLLHLLGYNHETDSGEMREKEKALIQKFALPDSLIVRTVG